MEKGYAEQLAEEFETRGCRLIEIEWVDGGGVDVLVKRLRDHLGEGEAPTVEEVEVMRAGVKNTLTESLFVITS